MFVEDSHIEQNQRVLSVSELANCAKDLLEECFATVWVEGEISNFACPGSGHWYFSLKDSDSQIRSAMFRGQNRRLAITPEDGMQVLVKGKISLYTPRGDFQMIAEHMELAGVGALRRQFELLKQKLQQEGLFAETNKQPLPTYVKQLGVVTSATGAAIRDILSVLKRRFPMLPVVIYPSLVQGNTAAESIARAIEIANIRQECDMLLVSRGGGSLEDLWPFNEEIVARAIHTSEIPIVSGVGHEVDFTIADFVADKRAPTPSAAAELVTPDQSELQSQLLQTKARLIQLIQYRLQQLREQTEYLSKRLQHPEQRLQERAQFLDNLQLRLTQVMQSKIQNYDARLKVLARTLNAVSPLATLDRGYAIIQSGEQVVRSVKEVTAGQSIEVKLSDGIIPCIVAGD